MLDTRMRALLAPALEAGGSRLAAAGVSPAALTAAGWAAGAGACAATALRAWPVALGLWLANRLLDGLDGPVARAGAATDAGGFLDIVADFSVYAGIILGLAVAVPGRVTLKWPHLLL
jgi:phosphatidylglycerophosphate synthase